MLQIMCVLRANSHKLDPERSKNSRICANEVKGSERQGEAGQMTICRLQRTATYEPTALSRGVGHVPHLWLDIRGPWDARLQPKGGVLTEPRLTAWVNEVVPLRFAKALKGRDQSSERAP